MPQHWGCGVFPLYPFRKPPSDICKVTNQDCLSVFWKFPTAECGWYQTELGRRKLCWCVRVLSSTARHHPVPDWTPSGNLPFLLKKMRKKILTSVIYKFAVIWRAWEASCYLHTAFIWALDQLLMTLVSRLALLQQRCECKFGSRVHVCRIMPNYLN